MYAQNFPVLILSNNISPSRIPQPPLSARHTRLPNPHPLLPHPARSIASSYAPAARAAALARAELALAARLAKRTFVLDSLVNAYPSSSAINAPI